MNTPDPSVAAVVPEAIDPDDYASTLRRSFTWRYEKGQDVWSGEVALRRAADVLFAHLPTGGSLLDIGIGSAANVLPLLQAGHTVTGVDIVTPANWSQLRADWARQLTLIEANFLDWAGPEASFDMVSDLGCLHHQLPAQYMLYLQGIGRLLRADGRLGLCVYEEVESGRDTGRMQTTDHGRLAKTFTEGELLTLLASCGFQPIDIARVERAADLPPYLTVVATRVADVAALAAGAG